MPQFTKLFKSIPNCKRQHIAQIYRHINSWKSIESKNAKVQNQNEDEKKEQVNDENKDEMKSSDQEKGIYAEGTRFYFWELHRHHKHYIHANYSDLKEEILQNTFLRMPQWKRLHQNCINLSETVKFKRIKCNGYDLLMYEIKQYSTYTLHHLMALKLYTDYTNPCSTFCSILRSEDNTKIAEIANWTKLLVETVQCYGTTLKSSKNKTFYRGVSEVFLFKSLVMRFNLPTSTTSDRHTAIIKFSGSGSGLVLKLRGYERRYDVFKFECSAFSVHDESEVLFFGGDTVLRIATIRQVVNQNWTNYKAFIQPLNAIIRMISGLSIKEELILSKEKHQTTMLQLINHILLTFDPANDTTSMTPYIDRLLKYHVFDAHIKLKYNELINDYKWMEPIFITKNNAKAVINITNICVLFCNSEQITFLMQKDFILSGIECKSIIDNLNIISNMNMTISVCFKWPSKVPQTNISNISQYCRHILSMNWMPNFFTNSISFVCIEASFISVTAQQLFQAKLTLMLYLPIETKTISPIEALIDNPLVSIAPISKVTKYDFADSSLYVVYGYLREDITKSVPSDVLQLVLLFYAKHIPLNTKYNGTIKCVLHDPNDSWQSIEREIKTAFWNEKWNFRSEFTYITLNDKNNEVNNIWDLCRYNSTDIFEVNAMLQIKEPMSIKLIDDQLKLYYETFNATYSGLFAEYCEDNGFEDIKEELEIAIDDIKEECTLIEFDKDCPLHPTPKNDSEKAESIYELLLFCAHGKALLFHERSLLFAQKQSRLRVHYKIDANSYESITDNDLKDIRELYKNQCSGIYDGLENDDAFATVAAIGYKKHFDYLQHLVDSYFRDSVELIHKSLDVPRWTDNHKHFNELKEWSKVNKNSNPFQIAKTAVSTFSNRICPRV